MNTIHRLRQSPCTPVTYAKPEGVALTAGAILGSSRAAPHRTARKLGSLGAFPSVAARRGSVRGRPGDRTSAGTATNFLPLEIGWLSRRFAALSEQLPLTRWASFAFSE